MNNERGRLIGIGYRMLGSYSDAEDAASEALVRWYRLTDAERDDIDVPGAWLTRVVSRICLDMLGSARVRRENYVGQWLPEPVRGLDSENSVAADPADRVAQQESVTLALLVVLESLGPAQRVAFVLHDAFAVPFDEIATVLDRSPAACRQLASAARIHVHSRHRSIADPIEHDRVVRAFASASAGGDIASLVSVLAPDVTLVSDGGGHVSAARNAVLGSDRVARFVRGITAKSTDLEWSIEPVNGLSGIVIRRDGAVFGVIGFGVIGFETADGVVASVWIVLNPDKLRHWV
ncbi:RNA polymerase subunit sigma-24 [Rhodococcus sp. 06-462-5]|uniref:RNA polymerase sigma factor SigJ n=1 Tax=unclassified Rhodococcus (in: high G+C Gram-positive bacteria) TaxID=192944 RepID=UPI000B9C23B8|nr:MULTISPECIES: RNA polymerase sigma factor SigJ [unclassified Rhodococcus (in: high G+C Gram-positive bacteria)]OZC66784.1 RNA polymerase subunit sigma-24 [Rhodococcus sp. 06-462-5]OZE68998.1 RNA polymerase subunit sigma-24 [Rhodococcus sp. 02-925g]